VETAPSATSRAVIASRVRMATSVLVPPEPPPVRAVLSVRAATAPPATVLHVETGPSAISRVAIAGRARTVMSVRGQPEALPARAAPSVRAVTSLRVTGLLETGRAARALRPSPAGRNLVGPRVFPASRKAPSRAGTDRAATGLRAGRPEVVLKEKE
jgi:hypothetical protein